MDNNENMFIGWDEVISQDGNELIILEEGDYLFKVTNFERGRYVGSAKIPPCNKAILTAEVVTEKGKAIIKFDLILYRTLEWKLCSFFRCIGQKKLNEKLTMNWNTVVGSYGMAHIKPRSYENNYGETKQTNDVEKFIDYDEKVVTEKVAALNNVDTANLPF